jgi:ribosome biogenesis GTPase
MTGLVYKSTGSWYTVKSEQGDFIECRMKGKFRIKGIKHQPIAVGDVVDYELEESSDTVTGTIQYSREKELHRSEMNLSHQMHIASNIDRVFLHYHK